MIHQKLRCTSFLKKSLNETRPADSVRSTLALHYTCSDWSGINRSTVPLLSTLLLWACLSNCRMHVVGWNLSNRSWPGYCVISTFVMDPKTAKLMYQYTWNYESIQLNMIYRKSQVEPHQTLITRMDHISWARIWCRLAKCTNEGFQPATHLRLTKCIAINSCDIKNFPSLINNNFYHKTS